MSTQHVDFFYLRIASQTFKKKFIENNDKLKPYRLLQKLMAIKANLYGKES